MSITGAGVAGGATATPTLAVGNVHVAGTGTSSFTVNNTGTTGPVLRGAIQNNGAASGLTVTAQNFGPIALGGSSAPQSVSYTPTAAGALGGSFKVVSNFDNVASQTVSVTGAAYDYAKPVVNTAQPVAFGNLHVGDIVTAQSLSISNATVSNAAFQEGLEATVTATTGGVIGSGSVPLLAAGRTNTFDISLGISTASAGAKSGTATLGFVSDGAGTSGLGQTTLASQTVQVTGSVYNLASSSTIAPVNFGVVHVGSGTQTKTLSVTNTAAAGTFSEGLNTSFGAYTNTGTIGVTSAGSITNLAAGATDSNSLSLSISTAMAGTVSGTIQVHQASNGTIDGLANTSLADQNPAVSGTVQATVTNLAVAQINTAQPVAFGNVRINSAQSTALSITNAAPASSFSESLIAGTGATTGGVTASGGFGPPTVVPSLAAQATDTTHVLVGIDTTTAGSKSGAATLNFASDGTAFAGGGITQLASQNVSVTGAVYRLASPTLNTGPIALAARVGGIASAAVSVTNTSPDIYTEGLAAGLGVAPSGFTSSGTITNLAAGATDGATLKVALNTATSGSFTGTQAISFTSTGAGTDNAAGLALTGGSVGLTGKVYQAAVASVSPNPVNFGIVHVGDAVAARALTVGNTASGALHDVLTGGFGTVSGGAFSGSGTLGAGVVAGSSSTALQVVLNTTSAGVFGGSAALSLASHDADLADIAAAAGPVGLNATVNNYAVSGLGNDTGSATLTGGSNAYTLNFGTVTQGGTLTDSLFGENLATGPADLLSGLFSVRSGSGFGLGSGMSFSDIAAGLHSGDLSVSFDTSGIGIFTEVLDLAGTGSNASGYDSGQNIADTLLTIEGDVVAAGGGGTSVPEPGTLALLAVGLAGLFGVRRGKARAAV